MTNENLITIAGIELNPAKPTHTTRDALYSWVVWQYPRSKGAAFCGAVHPPQATHGWWPALLNVEDVQIFAHLKRTFATPEAAADWLTTLDLK